MWKALHKLSKIFVEYALHVARLQFRNQAQQLCVGYCRLSYDHHFINKGMLAFERQLNKVKTRLTTLYVAQKLVITTIIDQIKLWKLQWIPMLINTHISAHYKSHACEQAYMIHRGYRWGKEEKNSFIFSTSRPTLLWPHFHENLSGVIVHL